MKKQNGYILLICIFFAGNALFGQGPPCADGASDFQVDLTTDDFGGETSWTLEDINTGDILLELAPGGQADDTTVTYNICIPCTGGDMIDDYRFTIFDAFGDGICCGFGFGEYTLSENDNVIFMGDGIFGAEEITEFDTECLPLDPAPIPTLGEWGIIALALMLMIFSALAIQNRTIKAPIKS